MIVVTPLPDLAFYLFDCSSQKHAHSEGCMRMKLFGIKGKGTSLSVIPSSLAIGQVMPTLLPPSEQLDSDSTHSHHADDLKDANCRCSAKVTVPASSSRAEPFTMLQSTPMLSM